MVTMATVEAFSVQEAVAKVDEIHKAFGSNVDVDVTILADKKDAEQVSYSFPWLKNNNTQEENIMTGTIQFANFAGIGNPPQRIASAASAIETAGLMGASYKPILFVGTQIAGGVNYWFFAEQTLKTNPLKKRIVKMAVNEFQGKFEVVKNTIKVVIE
ncbi:MAG: hypothetical protein IJQ82_08085 [Selenomonadaceae bacterium]|nr:hypothetical protein [Selenomonadaceae bacterium]